MRIAVLSRAAMRHHHHIKKLIAAIAAITMFATCSFALAQQLDALKVTGSLVNTRGFTAIDLKSLHQTEIVQTHGVESTGARDVTQLRFKGVLLRDLLAAASLHEKERYDLRKTVIIARARDSYVALFTWAELFNTKLGDNVMVITELNGKALPDDEGPYALRAFGDSKPGPRHVKWLDQIEVMKVVP